MPHCVIECPVELQDMVSFSELVKIVHDAAERSNLFADGDIKSRAIPVRDYLVGGKRDPFVHVTTHILEGRDAHAKKQLASEIASSLCRALPQVKMISVEVRDIKKLSYANRASVT